MATIAVIDDEEAIQDVLRDILQIEGHNVLTFFDGAPFLEVVGAEEIDLVITDLVMPTNGEDILRALGERGVRIPVIIMAGHIPNATACFLLAMGAHGILQKPVEIRDLLEVVDKWAAVAV